MSIKCGHCKGRHSSVAEARQCASGVTTSRVLTVAPKLDLKTPGFIRLMQDSERDEDARVAAFKMERWADEMDAQPRIIPDEALAAQARWDSKAATPQARVTEDGMYRMPNGDIFKVQVAVHGSGRLYAKQLVKLDVPEETRRGTKTHEFVYVSGAINRLTPAMKMTIDEQREFGALYGTCCRCGLMLTKEESIERGMGSTCAGKARAEWAA